MSLWQELRFRIKEFDLKIDKLESEYRERHINNFSEEKMNRFVNRKLKNEINELIVFNLKPSLKVINS